MKKLEQCFKNNKRGITLIALVITIIVLLILAGVTIASLSGDNGILQNAGKAKEETELAQKDEENILSSYEDKLNEYAGIDWDTVLANAQKHPDQKTSTAIGVGTDGRAVNMDLWEYTLLDDGTYGLNDEESLSDEGTRTSGYNNSNLIEGKIQGTIPQYIKDESDEEFIPVTNISYLFYTTDLSEVPIIPSTVTNMRATFNTTKITKMPEIPYGVTNMYGTFATCTNLTYVTEIPDSVLNMMGTFNGCTSLTEAPVIPENVTNMMLTFRDCTSLVVAPEIPNKVSNMYMTFLNCTKLIQAPMIPNSVTILVQTFENCTNLQGTIEINANVTGVQLGEDYYNHIDYDRCLRGACMTEGLTLQVTGTCPKLEEIVTTANNSNITLE